MYIFPTVIRVAFEILDVLILARVLLSWITHDYSNPIVRFVYEITEPILAPIRRIMPRTALPIDFSPIIAILLLNLIEKLLLGLL
ncbi:MAG: YggT family protein [Zhaonellaceae bacterium]|jgi:YggT family protein|nr:YggT family protein [Clostridia bacterium]